MFVIAVAFLVKFLRTREEYEISSHQAKNMIREAEEKIQKARDSVDVQRQVNAEASLKADELNQAIREETSALKALLTKAYFANIIPAQIIEQRITNAKLGKVLEYSEATMNNTAVAAKYAQIAAVNSEITKQLAAKQLAYQKAEFWLK